MRHTSKTRRKASASRSRAKNAASVVRESADYQYSTQGAEKTVAEFFAGIGLMRIGLERAGWQIEFANDIDAEKCQMYREHFRDTDDHLVLEDIHKLDPSTIPSVTLATASFPCNDLSLAGARVGLGGSQSSAFWGFTQVLRGMGHRRPRLVLVENVVGFLTSHGGTDFTNALIALNRLGYAVDAFVLDAARFVPQSRPRLFVLGVIDTGGRTGETMRLLESDARPKALAEFIFHHKDIRWRIRPLPQLPQRTTQLIEILEDLPTSAPEWWNRDRASYLLSQMSPKHREIADRMIAGREWSYGTVFRRIRHGRSMAELRTDGIAGCLRTPRGGSGRQILFKAGKGQYFVRLLTPRECARLMGANSFRITASLNQALFGFGDAVCVPVIEWIAKHYLNPIFEELQPQRTQQLVPAYA